MTNVELENIAWNEYQNAARDLARKGLKGAPRRDCWQ